MLLATLVADLLLTWTAVASPQVYDGSFTTTGPDVSCVAKAASGLRVQGVVTPDQAGALVSTAAQSSIGK